MICVDDLGSAFWLLFIEKIGFVELKSLCGSEGQRQVFEIIFLIQFFTIFAIIETFVTTLSVTYIRTKFDSVTFSMNGTFMSVCVSSQTDSWANLYRVKKPLIAEWKKEIALRPVTPSPPPSFG